MSSGIRATVEFTAADTCRLAELSSDGVTVDDVSTSVGIGGRTNVTEFSTDAAIETGVDIQRVFSHGETHRYRLAHDGGTDCPCECLGGFGCPVARYLAREGRLRLVFHVPDYEQLREIVAELRSRWEVHLARVIQSSPDDETDSVIVERGRLTPRQREVLETAYEIGYFERPREANASDVATRLGLDPSTVSEHLVAAEAKLFEDIMTG
jgi:predicted DNA binding protein